MSASNPEARHGLGGSLLCVANFSSNTGYAWDFIEALYAGVSDRLSRIGWRTYVAYPALNGPPRSLAGHAAEPIELGFPVGTGHGSLAPFLRAIRTLNVKILYLSDRPVWHPYYLACRRAGVRRIVVHDHTSGTRTRNRGIRRWLKRARAALPGMLADHVIGVSDYVVRRKIEVDLVSAARVTRVWNTLEPTDALPGPHRATVRRGLGVPDDALLVACAGRAAPQKGIDHLMRAFDRVAATWPSANKPRLVYVGDGPALPELTTLRDRLASRDLIILTGYRADARQVLGAADVAAFPSTWQEAFGLGALEPMAQGVPVVGSRVGALDEIITDGKTGCLVPPGDEEQLADRLRELLLNPDLRGRLGAAAHADVRARFDRSRQIETLTHILTDEL